MKMRSEHSWSLLDPKPVLFYVDNVDDYIVYWNGVVMPHSMALCIAMEFLGVFPTPEMKLALERNYSKLYYANAFNTRAWDRKAASGALYPYLKHITADHVKKTIEGKDPKDVLGWFNYKRARKNEHLS
jgi:hypothetical protein